MSQASRFTTSSVANKNTQERLSSTTVGLATLDDFRKRRAEVLEEQARRAAAAIGTGFSSGASTPNAGKVTPKCEYDENTLTDGQQPPSKKSKGNSQSINKKLKKKGGLVKLSFEDDDDEEKEEKYIDRKKTDAASPLKSLPASTTAPSVTVKEEQLSTKNCRRKLAANAAVGPAPKTVTKAALKKKEAEREALRKEFLARQSRVKDTEIAIPFVFYDGSDIPGGVVRVRKGDHVWLFLDKSRKVGAQLGVGGQKHAAREWARVGVDDLLLVRGGLIIPHHFEFYFFIINKSVGPGGRRLFDYRAEAEAEVELAVQNEEDLVRQQQPLLEPKDYDPLAPPTYTRAQMPIEKLEGACENPSFTKVVDRRWYERNKHIYPASTWQEFDPEKDYTTEIRRDGRGNALFYS